MHTTDIFDQLVQKLRGVPIDGNDGKHWCFGRTMEDVSKFAKILELIVQLIDKCDARGNRGVHGEPLLEKKQLVNLYGYLYNCVVSNIRYFSEEIQTCKDRYEDTPLVVIYIAVATIVLFINNAWPEPEPYMDSQQRDIPYCVEHGLAIVDCVAVRNFSTEEWISSVNAIAYATDRLTFCDELIEYVDALEHRLCQLLLNCYDERVHNISSFRTYSEEWKGYTFSTSGEYMFITAMLSLRFTINSATEALRDFDSAPMYAEADIKLANRLQAVLVERASKIYDVLYKNKFKKDYTTAATTTMEGFLYLKTRNFPDDVKPPEAIRQFRVASDWMRISERTAPDHLKIYEFLRKPNDDVMGFKVAFRMVMNIIFMETINVHWDNYFLTGYDLACAYEANYKKILENSNTTPMFVESLADACVLVKEKLVVFGKDPFDYFMAFVYWVECVRVMSGGKLGPAVFIHKLVAELFGTHIMAEHQDDEITTQVSLLALQIDRALGFDDDDVIENLDDLDIEQGLAELSIASASAAQRTPTISAMAGENGRYFSSLFDDRVQERANFEKLSKIIPTLGEDLESVPAFPVLDQQGLPSTSKSGWS